MSFNSLTIETLKTVYTEDMIINIFWKNFLGKVYRVDFEPIINNETGSINKEYQTAIIYRDEKYDWSDEIIKSINQSGNFILYHTNFDGSNDCWTMYKNANPIPRATILGNIHQLQHNNKLLCAHINKLEKELSEVKNKTN